MEAIKQYSILIVDDIFLNRKLARAIMQDTQGIIFHEAEDGVQAMDILEKYEVDLLILDIMMPNKDGFEVLQEMKEDTRLSDIPVIVYSAIDRFDEITKAFELGAIDYFVKPLTPQQMKVILPIKIKNALAAYEQKRLLAQEYERMQKELTFANIFQQSLMPKFFNGNDIEMYGRYFACEEMGGDFYDCLTIKDTFWFIIADVSGHGLVAAMLSSMIKLEFQNCIGYISSPSKVLTRMNEVFFDVMSGNYFTAFIGKIEGDKMIASNAGHPHPFHYIASEDKVVNIESSGFMVGCLENVCYDDIEISVAKGDRIFLYTDGLLDRELASCKDWQIVYNEIAEYICSMKQYVILKPEFFLDDLVNKYIKQFNEKQTDDIAMMLLNI